jgi:hypothetical protein
MNHRRGISLTELLVVMSACGVVISLSSSLVCRVMRIEIESRSLAAVERNALRLSEQFRHDVQQAQTAETPDNSAGEAVFLRLRFADGRQAEYSRQDDIILRKVSGNGLPTAREEFEFPATSRLEMQIVGSPQRIVLTISTPPVVATPSDDQPFQALNQRPVSLHAEATLGRDLRFTSDRSNVEVAP